MISAVIIMRMEHKPAALRGLAAKRRSVEGSDSLECLAADHLPEGIRGNAVGPGPIFSPFHQHRTRLLDADLLMTQPVSAGDPIAQCAHLITEDTKSVFVSSFCRAACA